MKGYFVLEILELKDPAAFAEYMKQSPAIIKQCGGKYLVRGGAVKMSEGGWNPTRLVVVEFPSVEQAMKFYNSPEYQKIYPLRRDSTIGKGVLVEGYPEE